MFLLFREKQIAFANLVVSFFLWAGRYLKELKGRVNIR